MIYVFRNKTGAAQHINVCDGSGHTVEIGGEIELDINTLFPEEIERVKLFFDIVSKPVEERQTRIVRKTNNEEA